MICPSEKFNELAFTLCHEENRKIIIYLDFEQSY